MKEEHRFCTDSEFDPKSMEYYSLLPSFLEEGELSYWIGNPSVEITNGSIMLKPLTKPAERFESSEEYFDALREANQSESVGESEKEGKGYCLLLNGIPNNKGPS
jgi:hypothetical protein